MIYFYNKAYNLLNSGSENLASILRRIICVQFDIKIKTLHCTDQIDFLLKMLSFSIRFQN
jgi:hypothetical protein